MGPSLQGPSNDFKKVISRPSTSPEPAELRGLVVEQALITSPTLRRDGRYQLALRTPGNWPTSARLRKHMRQTPKYRMYPRGRPHRWHRLWARTGNLGSRSHF